MGQISDALARHLSHNFAHNLQSNLARPAFYAAQHCEMPGVDLSNFHGGALASMTTDMTGATLSPGTIIGRVARLALVEDGAAVEAIHAAHEDAGLSDGLPVMGGATWDWRDRP